MILPYLPLVARFFGRKIVSFPPLKVSVVFHHVRNGLLLAALPPGGRLGEGQAEQAAAGAVAAALGGAAVGHAGAAAAAAALAAAGGAEASQRN